MPTAGSCRRACVNLQYICIIELKWKIDFFLSLKTLHDKMTCRNIIERFDSETLYKNNLLQQFSYNKLSTADDLDDEKS